MSQMPKIAEPGGLRQCLAQPSVRFFSRVI